ncbi:hypothetical protein D3C72_2139480 [compost metagenome]
MAAQAGQLRCRHGIDGTFLLAFHAERLFLLFHRHGRRSRHRGRRSADWHGVIARQPCRAIFQGAAMQCRRIVGHGRTTYRQQQ